MRRGSHRYEPGLTPRPISVEDSRNANLDAILALKAIRQGFGDALPFIIASTGSDGIDMSPASLYEKGCVQEQWHALIFGLWMNLRITVDL